MIFDVKYTFTDFYRFLDSDKNEEISINEFFNGTIELMEAIGISFKSEMKKNLNIIADIIKLAGNDVKFPTCN